MTRYKILGWGAAAFLAYWLIRYPAHAGHAMRGLLDLSLHAAHSLARFLNGLTS